MQEPREMDLRQRERDIPGQGNVQTTTDQMQQPQEPLDHGSALQMYLDQVPINLIPGIRHSPDMEVTTRDRIADAIRLLYEKDVWGAPISEGLDPENPRTNARSSDRFIGFIDLPRMVLWCLQQCEKSSSQEGGHETTKDGIFAVLEQNPQVAGTKVGELAKSFLWDPFFPVWQDDTLFHVLLLLSKHRMQVVPVIEPSTSKVAGYITQIAVIQLLLQSSGLEWFESVVCKPISEVQFEGEDHHRLAAVHGHKSLAEALHMLLGSGNEAIAVVDQGNGRIIGCIRNSDVHLLLENEELFTNIKKLTAEEFIQIDPNKADMDSTIERDHEALFSAGTLRLRNSFRSRMDLPATIGREDTLKKAMETFANTKSSICFSVDDSQRPTGILTSRDVIIQFAPPGVDSNIQGGGFFQFALQQTGCHIRDGTVFCNH